MGRHNTKNVYQRAPNVLYGFTSMYLLEALPVVLTKKPFNFRRNSQTYKGQPGANYPDGTPKLFTYEIAFEIGVDRTGPKEQVLTRLRDFLATNPDKVPECVQEKLDQELYQSAKENDERLKDALAQYHADVHQKVQQVYGNSSAEQVDFPLMLLYLYHFARKHQVGPTTEKFLCDVSGSSFTKTAIEPALTELNTTQWTDGTDPSSNLNVQRRTPACALRLFTMLMVDDKYCKRLLYKVPTTFWSDVCKDFRNDGYAIPGIPVEDPVFLDPDTKSTLDISICQSRWVDPEMLAKWYETTHMMLAAAKRRFYLLARETGTEIVDLKTLDGIKHFLKNIKSRVLMQLILLAWWRWKTDDVISEWFAFKDEGQAQGDDGAEDYVLIGGSPGGYQGNSNNYGASQDGGKTPVHVSTGRRPRDLQLDEEMRKAAKVDEESHRNGQRLKRAKDYLELANTLGDDEKRCKKLKQLSYAMIDKAIEVECEHLGIQPEDLDDDESLGNKDPPMAV